jgi:hypothetical protein
MLAIFQSTLATHTPSMASNQSNVSLAPAYTAAPERYPVQHTPRSNTIGSSSALGTEDQISRDFSIPSSNYSSDSHSNFFDLFQAHMPAFNSMPVDSPSPTSSSDSLTPRPWQHTIGPLDSPIIEAAQPSTTGHAPEPSGLMSARGNASTSNPIQTFPTGAARTKLPPAHTPFVMKNPEAAIKATQPNSDYEPLRAATQSEPTMKPIYMTSEGVHTTWFPASGIALTQFPDQRTVLRHPDGTSLRLLGHGKLGLLTSGPNVGPILQDYTARRHTIISNSEAPGKRKVRFYIP